MDFTAVESRLSQISNDLGRISLQKDFQQLRRLFNELSAIFESLARSEDEPFQRCVTLLGSILSSMLRRAALEGHVDTVQLMVSSEEPRFLRFMTPEAAVHDAVRMGHETVVARFADACIDINSQDEISGRTLLVRAAQFGKLGVARVLLDRGANTNILDKKNRSALMYAGVSEHLDALEIFRLILQASSNLDHVDEDGCSVLHFVSNRPKMAQLLLQMHVNVNLQDNRGQTALGKAAEKKSEDGVKLLLSHGAFLNNLYHVNHYYFATPFMCAVKGGDAAIVKLMIDAGAEIDETNEDINGALRYALGTRNSGVLKVLLDHGALLRIQRGADQRTLTKLLSEKEYAVLDILLDHFSRLGDLDGHRTLLCFAASSSNLAALDYLLSPVGLAGCERNADDLRLVPSLVAACQYGQTFRFTRDSLSPVNTVESNDGSKSLPMIPAISQLQNGEFMSFRRSTESLDKVETRHVGHSKILMMSFARRYHQGMYMVTQKWALVNSQDDKGETPLIKAVRSPSPRAKEAVRLLLNRGASAYIKDESGHTALDIAEILARSEIVEILKSRELVDVDEAGGSSPKRCHISRDTT